MTELNGNVYTVRNPATNTFELYDTDGTTSIDRDHLLLTLQVVQVHMVLL